MSRVGKLKRSSVFDTLLSMYLEVISICNFFMQSSKQHATFGTNFIPFIMLLTVISSLV
uniref:Uncharacterized protein n=1 Tax=Lepeophtheirus salmonis TaxID=72036 RepID=A0A0K2U9B6_LEPSM